MSNTTIGNPYLKTISEAVQQTPGIVVCPRTVHRWIAAGRLPGYRCGPRKLLVDVRDLAAIITQV